MLYRAGGDEFLVYHSELHDPLRSHGQELLLYDHRSDRPNGNGASCGIRIRNGRSWPASCSTRTWIR